MIKPLGRAEHGPQEAAGLDGKPTGMLPTAPAMVFKSVALSVPAISGKFVGSANRISPLKADPMCR
ncbi:hypothetical protein J7I84_07810 [Arthrobacter sp. ISL-85]|uniref:hypothetical protein n=1 Tax=Arthrobacter sp. ISL-85 TaxID=2819115 RepID=UPI001BE61C70|nr:hypothetical protein [Arthrobacter sp. ISL-85]MBT2566395.1 hypothetical protein [Arthrobacter sp. ISL-85]